MESETKRPFIARLAQLPYLALHISNTIRHFKVLHKSKKLWAFKIKWGWWLPFNLLYWERHRYLLPDPALDLCCHSIVELEPNLFFQVTDNMLPFAFASLSSQIIHRWDAVAHDRSPIKSPNPCWCLLFY
jgi:hypothetical protein